MFLTNFWKLMGLAALLALASCTSIKKYNDALETPIPVAHLQKDIKRVQKALFSMHPDIDWYIEKKALYQSFDNLAASIQSPMNSKDFYMKLAPLVANIKQGHTLILPASKKLSKDEKAAIKGSKGPFSQFEIFEEANKYYVTKDHTIDSSLTLGAELLKINHISPQTLKDTFQGVITGDGYNTSYFNFMTAEKIGSLYTRLMGIEDTLLLTLRINDSVFTHKLSRIPKTTLDSLSKAKEAALAAKDSANKNDTAVVENKKTKTPSYKYIYDKDTDTYLKELSFVDSQAALLKIKSFTNILGARKAYREIFDTLKNGAIPNLILDLRGNPGGAVSEINVLHGYITNQEYYATVSPQTITLTKYKMPLWTLINIPKWAYPIGLPFIWIDGIVYASRTQKKADNTYVYRMKQSNLKKAPPTRYTGNIWLLTNGGTFSAAAITAANFKSEKRGTIVGTETGGAYNGTVAGKLPVIKLKHSKLSLRVGTMNIKPFEALGEHGRGVLPDIQLSTNKDDKLNNIDTEVNFILNKIKEAK